MKYDKLIIYYFSGTGNAKNAAMWIIDMAQKNGLKTELINIDRFKTIAVPEVSKKTLIGFCSPTHGFNMPPLVLEFIVRFPRLHNNDVFILNTRGGLKLSRLFLPGLSGVAQILPALVLMFKGFRIVGMQPLDLPSNWLYIHPGLKKEVIKSIYTRCNRIVNEFATILLAGKRKYKALLSLPIDLAIVPLAFGYYFIGRFFLAKTLVATDACNNCNACILECPVEAIKTVNDMPYWTYKCESCMRCINICPHRAIETAHGFSSLVVIVFYVLISPLLVFFLNYYGILDIINQSNLFGQFWFLVEPAILVLLVFAGYRLLHYLMKFHIVNRVITYSSLSKFKFWRRYKSPKHKILKVNGEIELIKKVSGKKPN